MPSHDALADAQDKRVILLNESIYTDIVVTCARGYRWETLNSCIVFFGCAFVQLWLSIFMLDILSRDPLNSLFTAGVDWPDPTADTTMLFGNPAPPAPLPPAYSSANFLRNMRTEADNHCFAGVTITWWQCNNIEWGYHADQMSNMHMYASYLPQTFGGLGVRMGVFFGVIALLLFAGYQVVELRSICNYCHFLLLPSDCPMYYRYSRTSDKGYLEGLPVWVKGVVVAVVILRLAILCCLTYYGATWLCRTTVVGNFILNSVALNFFFEIDELCFKVFLSHQKQHRVARMEAPDISRLICNYRGPGSSARLRFLAFSELTSLSEMLALGLVLAITIFFVLHPGGLHDFANDYSDKAYRVLCMDDVGDGTFLDVKGADYNATFANGSFRFRLPYGDCAPVSPSFENAGPMYTMEGCLCQTVWTAYNSTTFKPVGRPCRNSCCTPDEDTSPWCMKVDAKCGNASREWGYCYLDQYLTTASAHPAKDVTSLKVHKSQRRRSSRRVRSLAREVRKLQEVLERQAATVAV